ncbi:hypothetical protein GPJ56_007645 [Histomonas meleagridis]|uniref:uncharacterized protein n=1 Tax=Histomonas meleagridis TaxID=135588 RepID=UPI00355AAA43|nr:hypothetical protein GPJ56_007645 [Histomonas meleagridis]KAH0799440.1 hypothetical protein GO595_007841 [Histomonas meleagridis]
MLSIMNRMNEQNSLSFPSPIDKVVELLPYDERIRLKSLIESISFDVQKTRRNSGILDFIKDLNKVHNFVTQPNCNTALRGMVCGIEFGKGFILVNTNRFKNVLSRSKSCLNSCFQKLGYDVMRPSNDLICLFTKVLPNVRAEFFAIRQWCVRLLGEQSLVGFVPNLSDEVSAKFEPRRIQTQKFLLEGSLDQTNNEPQNATTNNNYIFLEDIRSLLNPKPMDNTKPIVI